VVARVVEGLRIPAMAIAMADTQRKLSRWEAER
jgi:hypothetical protein